jgi:hypothetical protein
MPVLGAGVDLDVDADAEADTSWWDNAERVFAMVVGRSVADGD